MTEQRHRVEVRRPPEQAPVQQGFARAGRTGVTGDEEPERVPRRHHGAGRHERVDGLVRRPQHAVHDGDDAAPRKWAGVPDPAPARGTHHGTGRRAQVDAAVAGTPRRRRRDERAANHERPGDRRDPAARRREGGGGEHERRRGHEDGQDHASERAVRDG
jgi:hypothetical protein